MPGQATWNVGVLINDVLASRWFKTFNPNYMLGYEDATTFDAGGFTEKAVTLADFSVSASGTAKPLDHKKLADLAGSSAAMRVMLAFPRVGDSDPIGLKIGNVCVLFDSTGENFNRRGPVDGLVGYDFNQKPASAGLRMLGRVLAPHASFEATETEVGVLDFTRDLSTQVKTGLPAGQGRFQVHVTSMPVTITAATAKLETATNLAFDAGKETLATLDLHALLGSGKSGAVKVEIPAAKTVTQYLRLTVTVADGSTIAPLKLAAAYAE